MMIREEKGFTLIEMLVVIIIISGLAAILFPNFMDSRIRSKDAQRKSDLRQIQKALEMYKQDQMPLAYPTPDSIKPPSSIVNGTVVYLAKTPTDPSGAYGVYRYYYSVGTDLTYKLIACLENTADKDAVDASVTNVTVSAFTNATGMPCTQNKFFYLTQP